MDKIVVRIEADVNPTESEDKVRKAIENIFGNVQTTVQPSHKGAVITAEAKGREALTKLCNTLRRERIRAAARMTFLEGVNGRTIRFCLNKQVAFAGHLSFATEATESPLGPIKVMIESENPRELIKWLTFGDT